MNLKIKNDQELINDIKKNGNNHLFRFWDKMTSEERKLLLDDLHQVDFNLISAYYEKFHLSKKKQIDFEKPETVLIDDKKRKDFRIKGEEILKKGEVAFITVAGGQASRLGYDAPKGFFPVTPVTQKSLFEHFANTLLFLAGHYKVNLKWYIMTSISNDRDTREYFEKNGYFGLTQSNVVFLTQNMLPTISFEGKMILSKEKRLMTNPDGHGGSLKALYETGLLKDMESTGIKYLYYFQVDNPLIDLNDTGFLGYHVSNKNDVSTKVIRKKNPWEKLGLIAKLDNGKNAIIEYSDLPEEKAGEKDDDGNYRHMMGSIGCHIFSIDFLLHSTKKLPVHFAIKSIEAYNPGNTDPVTIEFEAIKFETFVFDILLFAKTSGFYECLRREEFSPLKNRTGNDSIETCRNDQIGRYVTWLKDAGFINKDMKTDGITIEISPSYAPDKNIFLEKATKDSDNLKKTIFNENGNLKNEIYIG